MEKDTLNPTFQVFFFTYFPKLNLLTFYNNATFFWLHLGFNLRCAFLTEFHLGVITHSHLLVLVLPELHFTSLNKQQQGY